MAKPQTTIWKIKGHTKAKHRILRRYLDAWFPIMAGRGGRIVYIDGFAGPGVYEGGEPGSPIIALQAFLEHPFRDRMTAEIVYVFIEEDAKRVQRLREEVDKLRPSLPDRVTIDIRPGTYEDIFGATLDRLEQQEKRLAPTFAFIDPFGYAQASMKLSGRFLQFNRCEVLIYVPFRHLARFVVMPEQESALMTLFGTDEWRAARELSYHDRLRMLHDLFQRQLQGECRLRYVRSFEIVSNSPNSGYHLFFGTNHPLGLEKMKEAMWAADPIEGRRFADTTSADPAQQTLFGSELDTSALRAALMARFGEATFSIEEATNFTLLETPYLPTHVKTRTLKPLEQSARLAVTSSKTGRRAGTFPPGTRMQFVPEP
jgi:three-Cys-motif partner protein